MIYWTVDWRRRRLPLIVRVFHFRFTGGAVKPKLTLRTLLCALSLVLLFHVEAQQTPHSVIMARWTWIGGTDASLINQPPTVVSLSEPAPENWPGSRMNHQMVFFNVGNMSQADTINGGGDGVSGFRSALWLFGGQWTMFSTGTLVDPSNQCPHCQHHHDED